MPAVFQKGSGERSKDFPPDPSPSGAGDLTRGRTLETSKLITNCLEGNPPQTPVHVSFSKQQVVCLRSTCRRVCVCPSVFLG